MKWGGDYESPHGFIENPRDKDELREPDVLLVAGTAWVFADEDFEEYFEYVFIDEAGQVALANAIVIATAARNVVLLGDPLQLAQVSKGVHPGNAGISVLEHLLGSDATVPPERGMFIQDTRRMHPDVCRFVSELIYEGRLESFPDCARQRVESTGISGTGLRFIGVEHEGNSIDAPEEASRIAAEIGRMLEGGTFTNCDGKTSVLKHDDFMIVAAYNAQVRCIAEALRKANLSGVPVGTVDKFQGREAPVVFFSMATSSGEELPRDVEFLFSRNRLNVAISRARALAIVVASPRLLDVACKTPEDMRLVNALCRFAEVAK
jgi:superfamily I DNA and/or RNA helicase